MPTHQIQLNERLYNKAKHRAASEGVATVDKLVADIVTHYLEGRRRPIPGRARHGIPKQPAHAQAAKPEIKEAKPIIDKQLEQELARRKAAWLGKKLS